MTVSVAVVGASGKLGSVVTRLIEVSTEFELAATLGSSSELSDMLGADVVVDVSVPAASQDVVDFAIAHGMSVLVGTSGWNSQRIAALDAKVRGKLSLGVIIIPNFSLGSVLATSFAAQAARYFNSIEIVEAHGAGKIDSPSGTAVRTAELMTQSRAELGLVDAAHTEQRARGQQVAGIPVHSIRMDGTMARQEVIFGGQGESLTIRHDTVSSSSYEAGIMLALRALGSARGVTVGLDSLLGLGENSASEPGAESAERP